ncbi:MULTISPECIES: Ig-like domain-containing protein [Micrococcaceae]|uniref:Ig-like domain-containing protein n=3 Tax=Micrococcales TaxID=85006 RepID=UPI00249EEDFA|nr:MULTISPECIES: Ig-like domain-containing protein [Micrococcaceae]MDJ0352075.1 Ig-like domain-containing protein [Pseudarthrobacter sp. PH31-O2]WGZ81302.1 Ig-like domain-containing protein [Arthrobacter sp. EM1]
MAGTGLAVASAVLITGAIIYPGFKTAEVQLNDGGVWVVSKSKNAVGRLNYPSRVLDGAVTPASSTFDVLQDAGTVFVDDSAGSTLNQVSAAQMRLGGDKKLPGSAAVSFGSAVIAVTDPAKGTVWALSPSTVNGFDAEESEPVLAGSAGTVSAVGSDDRIYSADPKTGQVTVTSVDAEGKVEHSSVSVWDGLKGAGDLQLSVVGDAPVVLDAGRGKLFLPGGRELALEQARDAKLQLSGPAADSVAVATPKALLKQPLDGSTAKTVSFGGQGVPAAPVQLAGCIHAAWSGANKYVRECVNDADDKSVDVPKASASPSYVFRVNRDLVVLNDVNSGNVWLVNQNMQLVNNWDDVIPPQQTSDDADKDSADEVQQTVLPDRTKPNSAPAAKPDSFGVRAGKTTILPVLDNDSDPDGDILTVRAPDPIRSGLLAPIYGSTGFQVSVPADRTGSETFKYTADDGRGLSAAADVTLTVIPAGENSAPRQKTNRNTALVVQSGKIVSQNILPDWIDPDGDDLYVVSATSSDPRDQVKARPDGLLSFQDAGAEPGRKTVTVTVSDGRSSTEGKITVDVRAAGALPPIANADHVVAVAGVDTLIAPLKNDSDPQGGALRLAQVSPDGNSTATMGADQQTFTFNSTAQSAHYVTYLVTNGPASAQQLVRVDVVPGGGDGTPVAVRDTALLPSGGSVLVDVLGNDSDPSGGVLVVQSVTAADGLPVNVAVLDHSVVRITDIRAQGQLNITYTISNGKSSASGEIAVLVVPAPTKLQAPQAKPDEATVRAGDVVTIPVLANDTDPNGGKLTLEPVLAQQPDAADGRIFTAGNSLRFIAGEVPKTVYAIYKVTNASGQSDSQQVTIRVRGRDDERNTRPEPKNLTARVVAGMTVRIPVPLDGVDADGDSVQLTGVEKAPAMGTALVKDGYLEFTAAGKAAGTDTFSYRVRDRIGAENTGTVIIGIAPQEANNQKPIAVDDGVDVRPGRKIAVEALQNDSDPDGDPISLVGNGFEARGELAVEAAEGGKVLLTAPGAASNESVSYKIQDDKKAQGSAVIRVRVSPDAALKLPIARDDVVTPAETLGKAAVDVPVLKNDSDPDGVGSDLRISLPDGNPNARVGDGSVRVALAPTDQLVPYTVTDVDGQSATAVIWVPGQGEEHPTLAKTDVVEVMAGKQIDLDLNDYVRVREGRTPRITQLDNVRVQGADPQNVVAGNGSALRYAALKDYVGPGSVTFEVTDGTGPDDPQGLKSTLSIITTVIPDPNANHQPSFSGATLEVPKAESASLELGNLAKDVDSGDQEKLTFELDGTLPEGFKASMDGGTLKVTADSAKAAGWKGSIPVKVTDGRSEPVKASITATVVASNRPLPVANEDVIEKANAGKTETINVLANDFNPFSDTPLKIVAATVETGSAAGQPVVAGDSITLTPAAGFKGVLVLRYTVMDKTNDVSRQTDGRVRITVRDKPDAPSAPAATDVRSRTAVLKWAPPSDNGATISKYAVRSSNGFSQECPTTTCTLSGLTNDVKYVFTVTATNEVGESVPSPASNEIRPDEKPSPPEAPTVKAGDKNMVIAWPAAKSEGSAVKSYNLEISPPPASGIAVKNGVAGLGYTWPGLTNGVRYKVRAQAVNELGPSEWGLYSAEDNPAGMPAAPAAPTTAVASAVGSSNQLKVNWTEPNTNGDAIKNYYVTMSGGGGTTQTQLVAGTVRTANFTANNSEAGYTFTVQAENKAGKGAVSAASAPRRATGKLSPVSGVSATPADTGGAGRAVVINFRELDAAGRNGSQPGEVSYTYYASPSGKTGAVTPGQKVGGFTNGQAGTITVTANSSVAPSSDASTGAAATPYGAPGTPAASGQNGAENQKNLSFNWSSPSTTGNDVAYTQIKIDTGGWERVAASGSRTINTGGFSEPHQIQVQTVNSVGTGGPIASASARSGTEKTRWTTRLNTGMTRSCTDLPGATSYDNSQPGNFTCDGQGGTNRPWMAASDVFDIMCWKPHGTPYSGNGEWYYIVRGSPNQTRWIDSRHTTIGPPGQSGVPLCTFPVGATP